MGTTVNNIHVFVGEHADGAARRVADVFPAPALVEADMAVTANLGVWLSVILGNLGIDAERLTMAHRSYAQAERATARASFLEAGH